MACAPSVRPAPPSVRPAPPMYALPMPASPCSQRPWQLPCSCCPPCSPGHMAGQAASVHSVWEDGGTPLSTANQTDTALPSEGREPSRGIPCGLCPCFPRNSDVLLPPASPVDIGPLAPRGPLMSCASAWNVLPTSCPGQSLSVLECFV